MSLAHALDRRQREPYANHPLRVTIRILSHYRVTDPHIACAALLHDVVEDHAGTISPDGTRRGALDILGRQFGERTAQVVAAVTNPVWIPGLLGEHRREIGIRHGTGALTCWKQAVFTLAWFRDRPHIRRLGQGFGIPQATAYRYKDEAVGLRCAAGQYP